jgi:hypothetical protein
MENVGEASSLSKSSANFAMKSFEYGQFHISLTATKQINRSGGDLLQPGKNKLRERVHARRKSGVAS